MKNFVDQDIAKRWETVSGQAYLAEVKDYLLGQTEFSLEDLIFENKHGKKLDLRALRLNDICLEIKDLSHTDFSFADLTSCKFSENNLFGSIFDRSKVFSSKLIGCTITSLHSKESTFRNCIFEDCFIDSAYLESISFFNCEFRNCDFSRSKLKKITFEGCKMKEVDFFGAKLMLDQECIEALKGIVGELNFEESKWYGVDEKEIEFPY